MIIRLRKTYAGVNRPRDAEGDEQGRLAEACSMIAALAVSDRRISTIVDIRCAPASPPSESELLRLLEVIERHRRIPTERPRKAVIHGRQPAGRPAHTHAGEPASNLRAGGPKGSRS